MRPKFAIHPISLGLRGLAGDERDVLQINIVPRSKPGNRKAMIIAGRRAKTIGGEGHRSITLLKNLASPDLAPDIMSRDAALWRQEGIQ
jgi:hypothetical protein